MKGGYQPQRGSFRVKWRDNEGWIPTAKRILSCGTTGQWRMDTNRKKDPFVWNDGTMKDGYQPPKRILSCEMTGQWRVDTNRKEDPFVWNYGTMKDRYQPQKGSFRVERRDNEGWIPTAKRILSCGTTGQWRMDTNRKKDPFVWNDGTMKDGYQPQRGSFRVEMTGQWRMDTNRKKDPFVWNDGTMKDGYQPQRRSFRVERRDKWRMDTNRKKDPFVWNDGTMKDGYQPQRGSFRLEWRDNEGWIPIAKKILLCEITGQWRMDGLVGRESIVSCVSYGGLLVNSRSVVYWLERWPCKADSAQEWCMKPDTLHTECIKWCYTAVGLDNLPEKQ